ncbi:MAG: arsenite methyltransferase [Candidatus Krumholzibacteriia bacterium]
MRKRNDEEIRRAVRRSYGGIATAAGCGAGESRCCGSGVRAEDVSRGLGYSEREVAAAPEGANLGLGCGNPQAIASLRPGETVVDLGSGAGFDCFLAARAVGDDGRVVGVDMTPEMIGRARENAETAGLDNVEFRLGEIEQLPVAGDFADVIISNCVINLSPDKSRVFAEAFRVLKPGGRLAVSDVVATAELPETIRQDLALHTGCVAGAEAIPTLESLLADVGFTDVRITPLFRSREIVGEWAPGMRLEDSVVSASIQAAKP